MVLDISLGLGEASLESESGDITTDNPPGRPPDYKYLNVKKLTNAVYNPSPTLTRTVIDVIISAKEVM